MDRMGNDQADYMAAKGRSKHDIDEWLKGWLKVIEHTVTTYHKWTAYTAAGQHNGEMVPDHDKRDKADSTNVKKSARSTPIPNDQRVLSRIGYATQSQGIANMMTVEKQPNSENGSRSQITGNARIAAIRGRLGNTQQNARGADLPTQTTRKMGDREHDCNI